MSATSDLELDEDDEFFAEYADWVAECSECEGSGVWGDHPRFNFEEPVNHQGNPDLLDCPVCCGFGRIDW